jgi:hypothetical protein
MELDTPLLHYAAFMINTYHAIPYKDIFETSMPGTFAFHSIIGALAGYSDLAFRIIDILLHGLLLFALYTFMKRFGNIPARWSIILFSLIYFSHGQTLSLQRDYIGIIPIAISLLSIPANQSVLVKRRTFFLIGLCFGLAMTIKPHLVLGFPILFFTLLTFRNNIGTKKINDFILCLLIALSGLFLPLCIALIWLAQHGALAAFMDISSKYLMMHTALSGNHEYLEGGARIRYLIIETLNMGRYNILFISALYSFYINSVKIKCNRDLSISFNFLLFSTIIYAFYPALAGKFWVYHFMPLAFFCSASAALFFYDWPTPFISIYQHSRRAILAFCLLICGLMYSYVFIRNVYSLQKDIRFGNSIHAPNKGRSDEIAAWLKARLGPDDTVQPLDWTGGSIQGMLIARAKLATRFLYDYHFYHHIQSEYTKNLREQFLEQLALTKPRFIIQVNDKPMVKGAGTTTAFPELNQFISTNYTIVYKGNGYNIYEYVYGKRHLKI